MTDPEELVLYRRFSNANGLANNEAEERIEDGGLKSEGQIHDRVQNLHVYESVQHMISREAILAGGQKQKNVELQGLYDLP